MTDKQNEPEFAAKRPFGNPYAQEQDTVRTSINIPKSDYCLVQQIRPGNGTMTAVSGTLWKALCEVLRSKGILSVVNIDEFTDFVSNATIVDRRELEQLKMEDAEVQRAKISGAGKKKGAK